MLSELRKYCGKLDVVCILEQGLHIIRDKDKEGIESLRRLKR